MKIFVTGGSGFVGQNMIPALIGHGFTVYALARSQASQKRVVSLGAIPVLDDLTAPSGNTEQALKACNYVLHLAAYMDFTYDPKPYYRMNVLATETLLRMAQENEISKFIYISAAPVVPGSPIVNPSRKKSG